MEFFLEHQVGSSSLVDRIHETIRKASKVHSLWQCRREWVTQEAGQKWRSQYQVQIHCKRHSHTASDTPQESGKLERALATLYGWMQSMMSATEWSDKRTHRLWMEAAATTTKLDIIMNEKWEPSPHQKFYNKSPAFEKSELFLWSSINPSKPPKASRPIGCTSHQGRSETLLRICGD